jgi:hypothetical protein
MFYAARGRITHALPRNRKKFVKTVERLLKSCLYLLRIATRCHAFYNIKQLVAKMGK